MIPRSLADVAELSLQGESFDLCLGNFLDGFYAHATQAAISTEPVRLKDRQREFGDVEDAYLAATAEWLAWKFNLRPPRWAFDQARSLRRPWFASRLSSLRAVLLVESPAPFRSRNIFISENALSRA